MKKLSILIGLFLTLTLAIRAQTTVCGNITGHWTLSGSPYIVTCDINVVNHLLIDSGVSVKFDAGFYSITVAAGDTFIARGTSNNPIAFESFTTQFPGGWDGLIFNGSGNDDSLFYCNIQSATYGIKVSGIGGPFITGGTIHANSHSGIYITQGASPFISDCITHDNLDYGIDVFNGDTTFIQNCIIYENKKGGIRCYWTGLAYSAKPKLFNCLIVQNCGIGIEVVAGSTTAGSKPEIANCTIAFNEMDGLSTEELPGSLYCAADPKIYNSILYNNGGYGIRKGNGTDIDTSDIKYNCFWQNVLGQFYNISGNDFGCSAQNGTYLNANGDFCDINYNICYNPMFTDLYCLKCNYGNNLFLGSKCINAATPIIFGQINLNIHDIGAFPQNSPACVSPCPADTCIVPVGIDFIASEENKIIVYPNPNQGSFLIDISSLSNLKTHLTITNLIGEKIKDINLTSGKTELKLEQPAGLYFVTLSTEREIYTTKIIIQR
ncbi:MAG TPA: right-handed parallel beta-helix repeat-containing protein [Bacteroidia bacterium]|nr:right-handed parallel beta-helix repeat-containing protein [Bacteroidia bacterium]